MAITSKNKIFYTLYIVFCLVVAYLVLHRKEKPSNSQDETSSKNDVLPAIENKKSISQDSLVGYWMVVGLGNDRYNYVNRNAKNYDLLYFLKYMPICFSDKGEKLESYSSNFTVNKLQWTIRDNDTLIEQNNELYRKYEIVSFKNEILKLNYCSVDSNNNPVDPIFFTLCRIHPEKLSTQSLFSKDLSVWRFKSKKKESTKDLKLRLNSLLKYNIIYLKSIYYSSYQALNTKHLHLPFDYYSNSMLFKTKLNSDNFTELFADTSNASEAYQILKEASKNIKYPKTKIKDDFILEYANYIDSLEKRL